MIINLRLRCFQVVVAPCSANPLRREFQSHSDAGPSYLDSRYNKEGSEGRKKDRRCVDLESAIYSSTRYEPLPPRWVSSSSGKVGSNYCFLHFTVLSLWAGPEIRRIIFHNIHTQEETAFLPASASEYLLSLNSVCVCNNMSKRPSLAYEASTTLSQLCNYIRVSND